MAETRSQRQRGGRAAGRTTSGRGRSRGRGTAQPPPTTITPIQGRSGAFYNPQNLSPDSSARAAEGLNAKFFVDRLYSHERENGSDACYAFQLIKPISVRIYDPALGGDRVECRCEQSDESSCCVHIYWLYDALNAVLSDRPPQTVRNLTQDFVISEISRLYGLIGERMNSLPTMLNSVREPEPDDEEELRARKSALRKILSVFNQVALPERYLRVFPEVSKQMPLEELFDPEDLGGTVYRLAVQDDATYTALTSIPNRDLCAQYYLIRQRKRASRALQDLDNYAISGSPNRSVQDMDVAGTLRQVAREICQDREARISEGPLEPETMRKFPRELINLLEGVCARNRDISGLNLYDELIGQPPQPVTWQEDRAFVIDDLRDLPPKEWEDLTDRLPEIRDRVLENAPEGQHPFATKIEELLRGTGAANVFVTSSMIPRQRRPTFPDERQSQRPRYG